ncbi:SDR family oxidoreductase [Lentzea sp. DG1S-22]|uniref:SDR family oxidoreductase n=1 Tax=Lentzea sp. DG1S-22 TaxID=3108822 RepID=UPI002E789F1B|nr:SDR family oxidoreductase [Lentzea sp. DG1S-22]WVH81704.1 SDR family oxidoreductase [Lentzea sp. DG1S-22]
MLGNVLVTGGAAGLGAAVAQAVREAGGTPLVLDKSAPTTGEFELVDLADGRAAEEAVRTLAERHGRFTGVVTAAGIDRCGTLAEVPPDEWEQVVRVNLFGTAAVIRAALPHLENGRVVTVASTLGLRAVSDATAYCASKFGVVGFTRALAAETAGKVGVTLVVPGGMRTNFFDDRTEQYRPQDLDKLNPPDRVAAAIVFALNQPEGCEIRELVIAHAEEPSWP